LIKLEQVNLIKSKQDKENKSKFNYSLSKKGIDSIPVILKIIRWSAKHEKKTAAPKKFVDRVKKDRERLLKKLKVS
jgi:DNA-binding HxlR family transcriptional regulator